jgi:peptidoglycan glycosyltransferase
MNHYIKKFMVFIAGCFLVYACYIIYITMIKGPDLNRHSANPRPWIIENRVNRGGIYACGGEKLAESIQEEGHLQRSYLYPKVYSCLLGYESRRLGKTGLEKVYDDQLLGLKGSLRKSLEVRWNLGRHRGNDLYLTIDHQIQERAWELLSPYTGAAVVLDPRSGRILAMVSTPGFDPNPVFLEKNWEQIRNDPQHPLLNRATQGLYPPGSIMKIVTAAIGVQKFPQLTEEIYNCRGEITVKGRVLKDLRVHGNVDLNHALAVSCNSYFATLGLRLGADNFASGLEAFGWGEGIPLDISVSEIPLPRGSLQDDNGLAEAAMGQGEIVVSPLFMALVAGALGENGVMMKPYLVQEIRSPEGKVIQKQKPQLLRMVTSPEVAWKVQDAMIQVVEQGTGSAARIPGVEVAGKTGSAENPTGSPHAWFVSFAPAHQPSVAVSVIVEHGGQGGRVAAPIARELMELALSRGD